MMESRRLLSSIAGLLLLLTAGVAIAHAQKSTTPFTITGIIRNAHTAKPVEYATVNLLDSADKTVSAAYSLENGSFTTGVIG